MVAANPKTRWWQRLLIVVLLPLIFVYVLLALALLLLSSICLHVLIWVFWSPRGRDILLVYSDSPIWHDYVEQQILPYLGGRAVVLNWSQRKRWRFSLARFAFFHFGGYRNFNPLAVVFRPFRLSRTFRFWKAFHDYKHGHPEKLHEIEKQFFDFAGITGREDQIRQAGKT